MGGRISHEETSLHIPAYIIDQKKKVKENNNYLELPLPNNLEYQNYIKNNEKKEENNRVIYIQIY